MALQEAFTIGVVLTAKDLYSSVIHKAERDLKRLGKVSEEQAAKFESSLKRWRRVTEIGALMMATGGRIAASFDRARSEAAAFHQALQNVMSIIATRGLPTTQVEKYREAIKRTALEVSEKYGLAASEVLNESYNLVSGIDNVEDAIAGIEPAALLATAGLGTMQQSVRVLTSLANTYGKAWGDTLKPQEKMIKIANMLAGAVNMNYTVIPELSEALENVQGDAQMANQRLETLVAMLGMLANKGLKGAEAGTALRRVFVNLTDVQKDLGIAITDSEGNFRDFLDILKDLREKIAEGGLSPELLDKITKAFDIFGARAVKALLPTLDRLIEMRDQLGNVSTTLDENSYAVKMANQVLNGYEKQLAIIEERWRNLRIELSEHALPLHIWLKKAITDVVESMAGSKVSKTVAAWAFAVGDFLAQGSQAAGTIMTIVGAIKTWQIQSAINKALLASETASIEAQNAALSRNVALWRAARGLSALPPAKKPGLLATWLPRLGAVSVPLAIGGGLLWGAYSEYKRMRNLQEKQRERKLTEKEKKELTELELRRLEGSARPKPFNFPETTPAYQTGGYVSDTGLALLHKGEWVLPHWEPKRPIQIHIDAPIHIHYSGSIGPAMDIERQVHRALEKVFRRELRRAGIA